MQIKSQRYLLWVAILGGITYSLAYVFLVRFFPPPEPTLSASEVVALYSENTLLLQIGIVIMICSGAFYLPWSVVIVAQMVRLEQGFPIWATLLGLASVIGAWVFAFPPVIWGVAAFTLTRDPELTLLLHEFGWIAFVTPVSYFVFQSVPIGVVSLSKYNTERVSAFPRWVGWLSIWTAILAFMGALALIFRSGPFAWNGIFPFYIPVVIFSIWFTAVTVMLFKALRFQANKDA